MIPARLNEINPVIKRHQRRIWEHYLLKIRTFWSPTIGKFCINKLWQCAEYIPYTTHNQNSHWFFYLKMEIITESGDKLVMRKEYLDREQCFTRGIINAPLSVF